MPLVFVHGVATRQTDAYKAQVQQRDQLFKRLVVGEGVQVFDPDWGSQAVKFAKGGWVPTPGATQVFAFDAPAALGAGAAASAASVLAQKDVDAAVDLAFGALLVERAETGAPLTEAELAAFAAAVDYLGDGPDRTAFAPGQTDAQFAEALGEELTPLLPATTSATGESMSLIGDVFSGIGKAVKKVTDPLRNAASDAVLRLLRKPLSNGVALFLGDIFVYLRWRAVDGEQGTYNRIFEPIIADLAEANAARSAGDRLIVVGHSLGGVILYDLLTDERALAAIKARSGADLAVDVLVTVGSQPGLFADMGLYGRPLLADGRLAHPPCVARWMNVFDFTDVFSFRAEPFFTTVDDFEFDNVSGALDAHTAYFQRPSFYKRLRARLAE